MFVTKEKIKETTGYDVDGTTLALAQMMIETFVGKSEDQIADAGDRDHLGKATTFQAVYILGMAADALQQIAVKSVTQGEALYTYDLNRFAPYMSPWAIEACKRVSWVGTRTVHTGPIVATGPVGTRWERD